MYQDYKEYEYPDYNYQVYRDIEDFINIPNKIQTFEDYKENKSAIHDYYNKIGNYIKETKLRSEIEADASLYRAEKLILNEADAVKKETENNINAVITEVERIENKTNALRMVYYNKMQELIDKLISVYIPKSETVVANIPNMSSWKQQFEYDKNLSVFSQEFKFFPNEIKDICDKICIDMNRYIREIEDDIQPDYDECIECCEKMNAVINRLIYKLEDKIRYCEEKKLHSIYVEYSEKLIEELRTKIEDLREYRGKTLSRFFKDIYPEGIVDELRENIETLQGVPGESDGIQKQILKLFCDGRVFHENNGILLKFIIEPNMSGTNEIELSEFTPRNSAYFRAVMENTVGYFNRMREGLEELIDMI